MSRRMFVKNELRSDKFRKLSNNAKLLYFHLCLDADDDGFVNNVDFNCEDLNITIETKNELKGYLINFEDVSLINNWHIHNKIRRDMKKETSYIDELAMVELRKNKRYRLIEESPVVVKTLPETAIQTKTTQQSPPKPQELEINRPAPALPEEPKMKVKDPRISNSMTNMKTMQDMFNSAMFDNPEPHIYKNDSIPPKSHRRAVKAPIVKYEYKGVAEEQLAMKMFKNDYDEQTIFKSFMKANRNPNAKLNLEYLLNIAKDIEFEDVRVMQPQEYLDFLADRFPEKNIGKLLIKCKESKDPDLFIQGGGTQAVASQDKMKFCRILKMGELNEI